MLLRPAPNSGSKKNKLVANPNAFNESRGSGHNRALKMTTVPSALLPGGPHSSPTTHDAAMDDPPFPLLRQSRRFSVCKARDPRQLRPRNGPATVDK